jgi:hypothetical protein
MTLYSRIKDFKQIKSPNLFYPENSGLIKTFKIDDKIRNKFIDSIKKYLLKSAKMKFKKKISEKKIIDIYDKNQNKFNFITPNGAIVPKKETQKEFNEITKNFIKILKLTKLDRQIERLHIPLNVRIKYKKVPKFFLKRNKATEKPHSDSWAGENSDCVNLHIPLFGDIQNNRMIFFTPNKFQEKWLKPLSNFSQGEKILKNYKKINLKLKKQTIILSDFATLHQTIRKKNCGSRISIDTTFVLKRTEKNGNIHKDRLKEYLGYQKFSGLGTKLFYQFKDSINDDVNSLPNKKFKHFSNFKLISSKEKLR